jgi:hypothetical protein
MVETRMPKVVTRTTVMALRGRPRGGADQILGDRDFAQDRQNGDGLGVNSAAVQVQLAGKAHDLFFDGNDVIRWEKRQLVEDFKRLFAGALQDEVSGQAAAGHLSPNASGSLSPRL